MRCECWLNPDMPAPVPGHAPIHSFLHCLENRMRPISTPYDGQCWWDSDLRTPACESAALPLFYGRRHAPLNDWVFFQVFFSVFLCCLTMHDRKDIRHYTQHLYSQQLSIILFKVKLAIIHTYLPKLSTPKPMTKAIVLHWQQVSHGK